VIGFAFLQAQSGFSCLEIFLANHSAVFHLRASDITAITHL